MEAFTQTQSPNLSASLKHTDNHAMNGHEDAHIHTQKLTYTYCTHTMNGLTHAYKHTHTVYINSNVHMKKIEVLTYMQAHSHTHTLTQARRNAHIHTHNSLVNSLTLP